MHPRAAAAWLVFAILFAGCAAPPPASKETGKDRVPRPGGDGEFEEDDVNWTVLGNEHAEFPTSPDGPPPESYTYEWVPNATILHVHTQFRYHAAGEDLPMAVGSNLLDATGQEAPTVKVRLDGRVAVTHIVGGSNFISINVGGQPDALDDVKTVANTSKSVELTFAGWGFMGADVDIEAGIPKEAAPAEE